MSTKYKLPQEHVDKAIDDYYAKLRFERYARTRAEHFKKGVETANETYSPLLSQMKEALESTKFFMEQMDSTPKIYLMKITAALESLSKYEKLQQ